MAEDVLSLLNYLQWTEEHGLHIVGISLGGMIAQGTSSYLNSANLTPFTELAYRIPNRIMSLSLVSTRAGGSIRVNMRSVRVHVLYLMTERNECVLAVHFVACCEVTAFTPFIN